MNYTESQFYTTSFMNKRVSFRDHHLLSILHLFDGETLPLDIFLRYYFRVHTAVGSKDRKEICDKVYGMVRWRGLLDHLIKEPLSWEARLQAYASPLFEKSKQNPLLPPHIRVSFPQDFYTLLTTSLGESKAEEFCLSSNESAPTTVRVNLLKTTRETLLNKWKRSYLISPCSHSHTAIRFEEKINFFATEEFKAGEFEVQDEASQLIAGLVDIKPGERFLDYCAGSGGKSLAVAPKLPRKGELFLHDIRTRSLQEAKKRLKRAGIQNVQLLPYDSPNKLRLKGKMDWVLVDAPCTGTGTLRRNPDMKWKFEKETLTRLIETQKTLFQEALAYVKPGGHIVYATCSVLPQENEAQSTYFLTHFPLTQVGEAFSSFPKRGEMDGFFGIVFKKNKL